MKLFEKNGLRAYQFESFDSLSIKHGVFTRLGGVSDGIWQSLNLAGTVGDDKEAVKKNHELLFSAFGEPLSSRFDVWQVHGTQIHFADAPRPPEQKHKPGDAIFTDKPNITLTMRFADCVPLFFHNPVKNVIGLVHAGWLGTMLNIGQVAIKAVTERYGSNAADLKVGIGPSICGQCYEVGEDVLTRFDKYWKKDYQRFFRPHGNKFLLDIPAANEFTLRQAGVVNIEQSNICTAENLHEWYSYRKEKGLTGRFAALIALRGEKNE